MRLQQNSCLFCLRRRLKNISKNKIGMILNPTDSTGLGLFSKCGRNQAMKSKSLRPASASKSKYLKPIESLRKKKIISDPFSKQESREQREKKYPKELAPAVGQYNPVQKEKPKLVWDILKAYQHQSQKKKTAEGKPYAEKNRQIEPLVARTTESELEAIMVASQKQANMLSTGESGSLMSSKNSQCMVNMSRMTGRKEKIRESWDWGQTDVLHSLAYVRGPISRSIAFDKMSKSPKDAQNNINPATNYSFDYKLLKQRKSAHLDFSSFRGREEKKERPEAYSYQHYEYDNYVWETNSRVYPNTKTHLIEFRHQTNRSKKHQ